MHPELRSQVMLASRNQSHTGRLAGDFLDRVSGKGETRRAVKPEELLRADAVIR